MWYPDLQSTEMLRLRSTAVDLHAQLTAQKLPAGNLSVDEVAKIPEEFLGYFLGLLNCKTTLGLIVFLVLQ